MTFGVNTSPLSGRDGKFVTSRQIKARLDREVLGNVSIEVRPTASPDTFEVRGRGELQLAVLIEQMRREGFELQVSRPEVLLHEVDGAVHEPYERITIDIPPEFIGTVSQSLAARKGRLEQMTTDADGRVADGVRHPRPRPRRLPRPAADRDARHGAAAPDRRGLRALGGRGHPPHDRRPGERPAGQLERLRPLQPPGAGAHCSSTPACEVYEGMIVGENSRPGDMDVNPTKEKKLTNIRTHSHDETLRLTPPPPMTLESAIEFIAADELVEVTPHSLRLRKRSAVGARSAARGRPRVRPPAREAEAEAETA